MVTVSSWGNLGSWEHEVRGLSEASEASNQIIGVRSGLAFGMGRSYGDVCLNPNGVLWNTEKRDRLIHFDDKAGLLTCQAGVLLRDIQSIFIPRGWMLPVTPGTQFVTVGGAIANDVHGKNHHAVGSFGHHVRRITMLRTDGQTIECGPDKEPDWFAATIGGIGLTGVILSAQIQLKPVGGPWIDVETIPYSNLDEFFELAEQSEAGWEHTVSWVDCISKGSTRGIFMRGNTKAMPGLKEPSGRKRTVPFKPPISLINGLSLRLFNSAYFHLKKRSAGRSTVHYKSFFYPLDDLLGWNKLYGRKGFYQYQCVLPFSGGQAAVQAMLREIERAGDGSFLAVLKTFGNIESAGMLSFAKPGVTLALDFPNNGHRTDNLFERLNAIVSEAGGRIYLAKDARMPRSLFESGYPRFSEFLSFRDPGISSRMSRRLMGS